MLNKDNQITIGNQKKKIFKAMLFSLHNDFRKNIFWGLDDIQKLQGLMSYYLMVEKESIQKIIESYDSKYQFKTEKIIKTTLANQNIPSKEIHDTLSKNRAGIPTGSFC